MPRPRRSRLSAAAAVLAAIMVGLAAYAGYLGWWGGRVFTWVPATAAPPPRGRALAAVFFSGDMGFNTGMAPRIADDLAAQGLPVLGINSLAAFAHRQSRTGTEALVRHAAEEALRRSGARRLVLIGQSFGANALLAGIGALPAPLKARVDRVVFVVPGETMLYRATPGGALDTGNDGPAIGAARALTWAPVLCIHGASEDGSLCPIWRQPNVRSLALPGDHYLHHDDRAVAHAVLAAIGR